MRLHSALALVFCIGAYAQEQQQQQQQVPLKSWFSKLSSYIPSVISNPKDALWSTTGDAAARIAATKVTRLTLENWRDTLKNTGSDGVEEWWVLMTGGNRTCLGGGQCEKVERTWNESAVVFVSVKGPRQAVVDCDAQTVLCVSWAAWAAWGAEVPAIWHILIPSDSLRPRPPTEIRILPLNASTVTATELLRMYTAQTWKEHTVYRGPFHPFDGWLAKTRLSEPYPNDAETPTRTSGTRGTGGGWTAATHLAFGLIDAAGDDDSSTSHLTFIRV
ncbi:MAG: hypothetical protein M1816_006200 [Peltula sp. TS41687]|nr:MAG: hypothetical protein M1816_006200 [Peltula sp. TS41687]